MIPTIPQRLAHNLNLDRYSLNAPAYAFFNPEDIRLPITIRWKVEIGVDQPIPSVFAGTNGISVKQDWQSIYVTKGYPAHASYATEYRIASAVIGKILGNSPSNTFIQVRLKNGSAYYGDSNGIFSSDFYPLILKGRVYKPTIRPKDDSATEYQLFLQSAGVNCLFVDRSVMVSDEPICVYLRKKVLPFIAAQGNDLHVQNLRGALVKVEQPADGATLHRYIGGLGYALTDTMHTRENF